MNRKQALLFAILVATAASLISFIVVALGATFLTQGESAEGLGILWALSQPAVLLIAAFTAFLFPRYSTRQTLGAQLAYFLPLVLGVALLGPLLSVAALLLLTALRGV